MLTSISVRYCLPLFELLTLRKSNPGCHGFGTPGVSAGPTAPISGRAEPVLITAGQHGFGPPALFGQNPAVHPKRPERVAPSAIWIGLAVLFTMGCNADTARLSEAHGTVLFHNKPVPNAEVVFAPDAGAAGPSSSAVTDADGHFTLQTDDGRAGAVVGKHRVTVRTSKPRQDPRPDDNPHSGSKSDNAAGYVPISENYGKANARNPLGVMEVTADRHTYDLNLK
jgi:hypothetical protein